MSETKNQLNPPQNSGAVNPNSTIVDSSKPVSPSPETKSQPTQSTQATPDANSPIAFHSAAIGKQTARPKDYFAEQNQETLTKKQAHSTRIRWLLIFSCGLVGVALVVGIIWFIVSNIINNESHNDPTTSAPAPTVQFSEDTVEEDMTELQNLANTAFDVKVTENENGDTVTTGDLAAAESVFEETLSAPHNAAYISQINLAKLIFYVENGEYESAIATIPSIEIDKLSGEQKLSYYNNLFIAYTGLGDDTTADDYLRLQTTTQIEIGGGGQG